MQIFITGLISTPPKTLTYEFTPDTKVLDLRDFIGTKYKYPNDVYILKCNGKILDNSDKTGGQPGGKTFDACGIKDLSTIHFVVTNTVNFNRMKSYRQYKDGLEMDK